jgi:phosphonopyruvate decarboxylase
MAAACGYAAACETDDAAQVGVWLEEPPLDGPRFARVLTRTGTPADLPRPSLTPVDVKNRLMRHFQPPAGVQ